MAITRQPLTLEEFLALPEEKPALEYLDGGVVQKVPPQEQHAALQAFLAEVINGFGRRRRIALALTEHREIYGASSPVPDVAVYRWARLPRTADGKLANVYPGPPDIASEILSPEQPLADQIEKCRLYVAGGVLIALLVQPEQAIVRRFGPSGVEAVLRDGDRIDLDAVLPGFELTVRELFDTLYLG